MAKITLTLNEQTSGQSVARYNLDTGGSALHIQAQNGVNYQFTDDATGLGPQGVTATKQGSDLVVTLDGSGPDLVIENYFGQGQGALIGVQADGSFTSYPVAAAPEHTLASEIVTEQALGSDQVPIAPLAVLGGVGLIAGGIALANDKDGKSHPEPAPAPDNNNSGNNNSGNSNTPHSPEAPPVPTPNQPSNPPPMPSPLPRPDVTPPSSNPSNPGPAVPGPNPPGPSPSPSPSPSPNNPNQPKPGSAPIAADDKESASPGETVTIDVLKNDSDPDGVTNIDVNSVRLLDAAGRPVATLKVPGEGEWNVTFNGHVTFKPEAGFTGNPTPVQYTISDAEGHTSKPAKITLTYDPTQQPNTPGAVFLEGEAKIGGTLKAVVADNDGVQTGTVKYQWFAEGDAIPGATGESYTVTAADRGKHISVHVSYTDGKNHMETHNGTTGIIGDTVTPTPMPNPTPMPQPNPNPAPNPLNPSPQMPGHPGIPDPNLKAYQPVLYDDTVKAHRGGKVTINVVENDTDAQRDIDPNTVQLLDKDGKGVTRLVVDKQGVWTVGRGGNVTFTPDKDFDKGNPDPVEYVLSDRNGNPSYNRAKITIEYPDAANNQEGKVELVGATKVGQTLIANVEDADGVQPENIKYQWFANGDAITGANGRSYTIQPIDRGKTLTVHVEYKDGAGHDEAFSSQPSAPVDAALTPTTPTPTPPPTTPNNPPSGNVTISGTAKVGEKLTASNDLQDADGMGSVKYRWFANGEEIGQGDSYTLKAADKGKTITVKAEYTDGKNHAESVESAKTAAVADSGTTPPPSAPNNPPSGNVTISGTAKVGEKLTASNDLQDADGMGSVKYRWFANGEEVGQGDSYTLKAADKGKTITVKAEYTDGKNHAESVESAKTAEVADSGTTPPPSAPNNPPSGNVTISGTAKVGEKLTASNDLQDADGMGSVKYRWFANGEEVGQGDSYTLKAADKGKTITVKAEYTDGKGTAESVESAKTAEVADSGTTPPPGAPNQPGTVTISGKTAVGETLTATAHDDDGVPANVNYGWFIDNKPVGTGASYTIQPGDKGKTITVKAIYTDGAGHAEIVTSEPTAAITDSGTTPPPTTPNNPPIGNVTISGIAKVGETLTASNDLQDDDGMGSVTYHWYAGGKEVGTGASYQLTEADKGKTITVKAEYTDGKQHAESVSSSATAAVEDSGTTPPPGAPNQPGSVAISGETKVGGELTATVSDGDGVPNSVQYQWLRDGQPIDGATAQTYRLTAADAGHKITVQASYDDNAAHHESPTSAASDIGAQNNADQPTVSISGSDSVNEGGAATYTVSLDHASDQPVTVTLTLKHIETTDADFAPQPIEKTLTIPAGQTSATFSVNTADDRLPENNEHYRIEISAPQGAKLDAAKTGVTTQIIDNDESAANHNGTNTDTTFAGDRNADTPYFVNVLDSGYNGSGHLLGHKPGEGIKVTYAFATTPEDKDEPGNTMSGFATYSESQKAAIRTVLDHIAEHVNVKYTEGTNATLNFYKHTMATEDTVGYGVYGGGVHLSAERFSADDAFRSDIPYKLEADDKLTEYYGWHAALHEVGHTLGLNHTFDNDAPTPNLDKVEDRDDLSVMSYTVAETAKVPRSDGDAWIAPIPQNKLGIYDLAALHHSFGVNPNYHSGDDTYGFKEFNKDAVGNDIYIHDGGGLDTFDAHEQTLDLNIDLTPGSWIYAGEKTAHLALNNDGTPTEHQMFIGYGTQIENAKGGTGNDTIKGNSAANYLFGFDGDDTIDGGAGNDQIEGGRGADTLTGGKGADHFIFASPLDGKADTITDFSFSEGDLLQLDHHIFTALESGTLAADQFVAGKEAKDANDHLLYDRTTGELAYDPDGSGSAAAVTIAHLGANHDLDHNGIQII